MSWEFRKAQKKFFRVRDTEHGFHTYPDEGGILAVAGTYSDFFLTLFFFCEFPGYGIVGKSQAFLLNFLQQSSGAAEAVNGIQQSAGSIVFSCVRHPHFLSLFSDPWSYVISSSCPFPSFPVELLW